MDALLYEYLVRMAYNCGRGGAKGMAEADIYRELERNKYAIDNDLPTRSKDDTEYDYRSSAMAVSVNVGQALRKVVEDYPFTDKDVHFKNRLDVLADGLSRCMEKEKIDSTIEEAHEIFKELGLLVR